jgi:hypothetical protein
MRKPTKLWIDYKTPTPPKWRKIGDSALILTLAVKPLVESIPIQDDILKQWLVWGTEVLLVLFKFWTNTQTDENKSI